MFSFVAYAFYLNRPSNTYNILALSMFFILLVFNPLLLFDVGFQMSYAAVFAIVWIYPLLQKFWNPKKWLLKYVWQLLSVSIAAQIGVLPISLYYFHQFPGLFFISNLLIVPFLGLILGLGIVVIALILLNLAPNILIEIYDSLIGSMNTIIGWVAQQEAFIFKNIPFDTAQLMLSYCLIIALIWVLTKVTFKRTIVLLICLLGLQSWSLYMQSITAQKEVLIVAHKAKTSMLMHQYGTQLDVFSTDTIAMNSLLTNYQIAERIENIKHLTLKNAYYFNNQNIEVIDSIGVYPKGKRTTDYVLMTQSPKINLERLVDSLKPKVLIADGSNYQSYVKRWQKTCSHKKLPFHYTGEKGAYNFYFD